MRIDAADLRVADVVRIGGDGEREITKVDRDPDEPKRVRAWVRGQVWTPRDEKEELEGPPPALEWWEDQELVIQRPGDLFEQPPTSSRPAVKFPEDPKAGFAMLRERLASEGWIHHPPKSTTKKQFLVDPTDTTRIEFNGKGFEIQTRVSSSSVTRWDRHREVSWYGVDRIIGEDFEAGVRKLLEITQADTVKRAGLEAQWADRFAPANVPAPAADAKPVIIRYSRDGGVLLCGETFQNKEVIKNLSSPYHFKPSRHLPGDCYWYVPKTRGTLQPRSRIDALALAMRARGVPVAIEYADPGELAAAGAEPGPAVTPEARIEAIITQNQLLASRRPTYGELAEVILIAEREGLGREMRAWLIRAGKIENNERGARLLGRVRGQLAFEKDTWPPEPDRGNHYSEAEYQGVLDSLEHAPEIAATLGLAKRWPTALVEVAGVDAQRTYYRGLDLARDVQRTFDANVQGQMAELRRLRRSDVPTGPKHAIKARTAIAEPVAVHQSRLEVSLDPKVYDPKSDPKWVQARLCSIASDVAQAVLETIHGVPFPGRNDASVLCSGETTLEHLVNANVDAKIESGQRAIDSALAFMRDAKALLEIFEILGGEQRFTIKRFNLAYWRKHPTLREYQRTERRIYARHSVRGSIKYVEKMGSAGTTTTLFLRGPENFGFTISTTSGDEHEAMEKLRQELRAVAAGRDLEKARDEWAAAQRMPRKSVPPLLSPAVLARATRLREAADRVEREGKPTIAKALRGAADIADPVRFPHVALIDGYGDVLFFEAELADAGTVEAAVYRGPSTRRAALEQLLRATAADKRTEAQRRQLSALLTKSSGDRIPLGHDDVVAANVLVLPFAESSAGAPGGPREVRADLRRDRKLLKFGIRDTPKLQAALREYVAATCHPIEPAKKSTVTTTSTTTISKPAKIRDMDQRAAKLRAAADKIEAAAQAQLDVDRKTNTRRRTGIAANIIARESRRLEIAQSMRRAADASDPVAFPYVSKIDSRLDVELIEREFTDAGLRWMVDNGYPAPSTQDLTPRAEFIESTKYVPPYTYLESLRIVLHDAGSNESTAAQRKRVAALIKSGERTKSRIEISFEDMDAIEVLLRKTSAPNEGASEDIAKARRRRRLGIHDTATLRAALREYMDVCRSKVVKRVEDPIAKAKRELQFAKIPGFFPTPRPLAERMVELAKIGPGMRVLEPSAGSGSIAEVIRERHPDAKLDVVEFNHTLHDLLVAQGFHVVGHDFMGWDSEERFDRILMNPPFEDRAEVRHIEKAMLLLAPGGRLVAIASGSFSTRIDAATANLRDRITARGGTIEPLPAGTFKDAGTQVATLLLVYDEPSTSIKREPPKRPGWAYPSLTDENIAAAEALSAVKAKWAAFELARPTPRTTWDSIPNTGCFEPTTGDDSLTVCVGGQVKPRPIAACPPLPDPPVGDRKLALCEIGEPVEWFGGNDYIPAVRAEATNRLARRRAKPAKSPTLDQLPPVDDFVGQAKLLEALVPSGIVYSAKNPTWPLVVELGGPHRHGADGSLIRVSNNAPFERVGDGETLVATVKLDSSIEFGQFIAGLGTKWIVYAGPLALATLVKLRAALPDAHRSGISLDNFRSGRFAGETAYWVEGDEGQVLTEPLTAEGLPVGKEAARAFVDEKLPKLEVAVPEGWSLDDAVVMALLANGKPAWTAWQPSTGLQRTRVGQRWSEPKPTTLPSGKPADVPMILGNTLRRGLDDAPRGTIFRVAGVWLGRVFPSDFTKSVEFEAPTGGVIDLEALRVEYAELLQAQAKGPTTKFGDEQVNRAKRRIAWANKWLKDQAKATKPKRPAKPEIDAKPKTTTKPKTAAKPKTTTKPESTEKPPVQPEAAIAAVVVAEESPCACKAEPTKENEIMREIDTSTQTAASSSAPAKMQTRKKTTKKAGKKKADGKPKRGPGRPRKTPVAANGVDQPKRGPGRPRKTPVAANGADQPKRGPGRPRKTPVAANSVEQPKRGPGRPRKTPATAPPAPAPTTAAQATEADTSKRPRRRLARNDVVRFRKRSTVATELRISESATFKVEHGLEIQGERYVMLRLGNSRTTIPIPEGHLVTVDRAEELPPELRTCVAQLGRYKGKLRPQVRHFLRELQRRA